MAWTGPSSGANGKSQQPALRRAVEAGDPGPPEADHVAVDRLGAAVRVGQPLAARPHPGAGDLERRVVERRERPGRHRRVALDRGEPRRERQPLAPVREGRVEQAQALAGGEVESRCPPRGSGPSTRRTRNAARCRAVQGGALVGVGRPVLAGEAVDRGRARGRGGEQGDVERQRQGLADREGDDVLVLPGYPPVREPVAGGLLDLGLGDERQRREAQVGHDPAQDLGAVLGPEAPTGGRPVRCRSRHRPSLGLARRPPPGKATRRAAARGHRPVRVYPNGTAARDTEHCTVRVALRVVGRYPGRV